MTSAEATDAERDVDEAVRRARDAQPSWAVQPVRDRAAALRPLAARILARADEIAELLRDECGKPLEEGLLAEVLPNADLVGYWVDSVEELLAEAVMPLDPLAYPSKSATVYREPRGVLALITPWNYPVAIPLRTLVPAVLAGNAVVFKPSEHALRAGALVAKLFDGLVPEGVVTLLQGGRAEGERLVRAEIDAVVFTGSVAAGKKIGAACAARLIPCSMELGGKDAAVVLADAPIERTARGLVWGAFTNAGQNCASIERAYVVKKVAEPLLEEIKKVIAELQPSRDHAAITTDAQAEIVRAQVSAALEAGAQVIAGSAPPEEGRSFEPLVLVIEDEACALMTEETFGPVLPIVIVEDESEALRRANDSRFGLTASLWTKDFSRAEELARKLTAGVVTVNNHGFTAAIPSLPWSGVKDSGSGVTNGPHALSAFVRPKLVLIDRNRQPRELWWYPYTPALRAVAQAMVKLRGGSGLLGRLVGFFQLLGALPKRLFGR
ncbi:MAG: aldehyde dehydrogenase family protein [Polyangiaceae bacterium]|jgi:acyl-CoA reductase-like NAD-dependent aldehyde dehydrogenase|nr:aldehyde dehydrogenase family protein [Polyangiaceae bacterium]